MNLKEFLNNKNIKVISFYNQISLEKILIFSLALKESINDIKIEIIPIKGSSKYFFAVWIEGEKTKQDINKFTKVIYELKSIIKNSSVFIKI